MEQDTPYGAPSGPIRQVAEGGCRLAFLPRHGPGHTVLPSEINHRANIYAFRQLGVSRVLAFTAVGSLREGVRPRDIALPTQYFDRTKQNHTFFGGGVAAHIPFGDPVCLEFHRQVADQARHLLQDSDARLHPDGVYVNIEGPAFSTRAESATYRTLGFDVIGMTSLPEAKLCREAGLCYVPVALVTDYDCWREEEEVHVETVVTNVQANIAFARELIRRVASVLPAERPCACAHSLEGAVMTAPDAISPALRERLRWILP
jgi:5'-methylthioadenosine phosphorylase